MKKGIIIFMAIIIVAVGLVGCSSNQTASSGENVYKVGLDATYPPFENLSGDKVEGFDIDIIKAVAEEAGIKINIKNTGWDPLFNGLDNGTVDIGISAITITDKRKETYDFSDPYFEANQLIMVLGDSSVKTLKDLEGQKIGVQSATTGDFVVQDTFGKTYKGLKGYEDIPTAVDDLLLGRIQAVVADNVVLQEYALKLKDKDIKLIKDPSFEVENYGITVKKGNTELLTKLNDGLKKIKENGTYQQIYSKYFAK